VTKQKTLSIAVLTSLGLGMGAASFSVQAIQEGDMFMRFTATQVAPSSSSGSFSGATSVIPEAEDSTTLGFTFVYMMSNNLGFEVLAALPFEHDITAGGAKIATTKQLPPTVSVQYYFNPTNKFRPYVGAGLNYTVFFNDNINADVAADLGINSDLELDDSFGLAVQAGFDYDINEKWFVNADIRYINIETTATNSDIGSADVDINPTVISLGVGYKF